MVRFITFLLVLFLSAILQALKSYCYVRSCLVFKQDSLFRCICGQDVARKCFAKRILWRLGHDILSEGSLHIYIVYWRQN